VRLLDERVALDADSDRVLHLLIGTFEEHVRTNRELEASLRQLASQNAALLRAEQLRKDLSALVVHDLKSPTSGLLMLAQSQLRRGGTGDAERARWASVYASAELLQRMIMNLLDVSRSEDGVLAANLTSLELPTLLEEPRRVLQYQIEERRQVLAVTVSGGPRHFRGDGELLRRVLLNLLDNASRHTPAGGRIELAGRLFEGEVEVRVANEGASIPEGMRERIFEKYVRLEPGLDPQGEPGRGLGLSFCRMALKAHGGRIWVEDRVPGGAVFCLRFPG
jgi:signal transduction histidine kinase